jgi:hypothetical protein
MDKVRHATFGSDGQLAILDFGPFATLKGMLWILDWRRSCIRKNFFHFNA